MAKFNAKENDPERYARVKEEQDRLRTRCKSELRLARLCPYCDYKLSVVLKCGEIIVFPPISFRMASSH